MGLALNALDDLSALSAQLRYGLEQSNPGRQGAQGAVNRFLDRLDTRIANTWTALSGFVGESGKTSLPNWNAEWDQHQLGAIPMMALSGSGGGEKSAADGFNIRTAGPGGEDVRLLVEKGWEDEQGPSVKGPEEHESIDVSGESSIIKAIEHKPFRIEDYSEGVKISNDQFGKKLGRHAVDFGLDPASLENREIFHTIIQTIVIQPDEVRCGT